MTNRSPASLIVAAIGMHRFSPELSEKIAAYVRAQVSSDVAIESNGSDFGVSTDYSGASGDFLVEWLKPSQLLRKLHPEVSAAAVVAAVEQVIRACALVFEESRQAATRDGGDFSGGWNIAITPPASVIVVAEQARITAHIEGAAGERVEFGTLDVSAYVRPGG